jgi:GntR family transcriptional regulator
MMRHLRNSNRLTSGSEPVRLEKSSGVPLYSQIEQLLIEKIKSGKLSEGEALLSEQDLARLYHVSRMTARQALNGLKTNGYAVSVRRKGTFVTAPKIDKTFIRLQGFSQEMRARGVCPSSKVLEQKIITAPDEIREFLQLERNETVMKLRRLRLADGSPIAVETSYAPTGYYPGIERIDFSAQSLYSVLQSRYKCSIGWSEDVIEASKATAEEAKLLTIPRGFGILAISRLVMSAAGDPIELCHSRYRSDRYRATIRIPR